MRKEQILLLAAAAIGALLVWSKSGKYTEVGAASLPAGKAVEVVPARNPDPFEGLSREPLTGRPASAVVRSEKRPPLPPLPIPAALPLPWVRPVPRPGPAPDAWVKLRTPIVPVAKEKVPDDQATAPAPVNPEGNAEGTAEANAEEPKLFEKTKPFDPAKAARLINKTGEETIVALEPSGDLKGQPDWVILEKWPNVTFKWSMLNVKDGRPMGFIDAGPDQVANYKTVILKPSLDNCFHEERIKRGVKDNDRDALVSFADWCFTELRGKSGEDGVVFGLGAVRKAIEVMEKAKAVSDDVETVRKLGLFYRAAFDLDGALRCYLEYLKRHATETAAQLLVGDAYERMGCWASARSLYERGAQTGDPESRLRVGLMLEREGDFGRAAETLKTVAAAPGVAARANLALARIALRSGDFAAAATYAGEAKKEPSPALNALLGSLLYVNGKFTEAATTFAAAKEDDISSVWRSNRAFAMLAAGELDGAAKEFQACLDSDPLNMLDPYFGLGEAFQRKAETDRSNAYYETALARSPKDPWMLLRVGTLRLRDGQAAEALKLGLELTEVAPGCNEGLWLVGRAAASLDTPDWDKAVSYLRRACAKEPENKDFLFEFARVLVVAGRVDEAIKVLDEATEVKSGFARTDGRLIGLLGWARFLGKRPMEDVNRDIARARTAVLDDATKEWLGAVRAKLEEWEGTRIWVDDFSRPASGKVGNGWPDESDQAHGITAGLSGEQLVFASQSVRQAAPDRQTATRLFREDPQLCDLTKVKEVETSFKAQMGVETIFHVYLVGTPLVNRGAPGGGPRRGASGGELGFGCDRNGFMKLWLVGTAGKSKEQAVYEFEVKDAAGNPRPWPMDDFHTVRFVRKDKNKGIWEVWFDDEPISLDGKTTFEINALSGVGTRSFGVGFLVDADAGSTVSVPAEYVKVTKTNK